MGRRGAVSAAELEQGMGRQALLDKLQAVLAERRDWSVKERDELSVGSNQRAYRATMVAAARQRCDNGATVVR